MLGVGQTEHTRHASKGQQTVSHSDAEPEFQPKGTTARYLRWAGIAIVVVTTVSLYGFRYRHLREGRFLSHLDMSSQVVPWRCFYSLALERNELGLWNPFIARGYPHHAEGQSGLLHPAHLLIYRVLPVQIAFLLELLLILPCAYGGMLLFLRRSFKFRWLPALFGAGLFAFSTFFPRQFTHINMLWVYAHLPPALFCLERCLRGTRPWRWAAGLAAVFASMILLGHPQMVWFNCIGCLVLAIFLGWSERCSRRFVRRFGLVLAAGLIALLIGMAQILPTLHYVRHSSRRQATAEQTLAYSLLPWNLLPNAAPRVFPLGFVPCRHPNSDGPDWSLENVGYLGCWSLLAIGVGLVLWRRYVFRRQHLGGVVIVALSFAALVFLTLGQHGGLIYVLRLIPLVRDFRCPARHIALLAGMVAVLAAFVLQTALEHEPAKFNKKTVLWLLALAAPILAVPFWALIVTEITVSDDVVKLSSWKALLGGPIALTVTLAAYGVYAWRPKTGYSLLAILMAVCILDTATYTTPVMKLFVKHGLTMEVAAVAAAKEAMRTTPHDFRQVANNNKPVLAGHYIANGYLGIMPVEKLAIYGDDVVREHFYLASIRFAHSGRGRKAVIREFVHAFPRARLVSNLEHAEDPLGEDLVGRPDFYSFLRSTALCRPEHSKTLSGPPLRAAEYVRFADDGYSRVALDVNVEHERLLVLSDRWWPHWRARVDGDPRGIIPLFNGAMRGVIVKPGEKQVVMTYESMPFQQGMILGLIGLAALAGLLAVDIRRYLQQRRARSTD